MFWRFWRWWITFSRIFKSCCFLDYRLTPQWSIIRGPREGELERAINRDRPMMIIISWSFHGFRFIIAIATWVMSLLISQNCSGLFPLKLIPKAMRNSNPLLMAVDFDILILCQKPKWSWWGGGGGGGCGSLTAEGMALSGAEVEVAEEFSAN